MSARRAQEGARAGGADRGIHPRAARPGVDEHRDRAAMEHAEEGHVEIARHRDEEQHGVPGRDAARRERDRGRGDALRQLRERRAPRAAAAGFDDRDPLRDLRRALGQPRGEVGIHGVHSNSA